MGFAIVIRPYRGRQQHAPPAAARHEGRQIHLSRLLWHRHDSGLGCRGGSCGVGFSEYERRSKGSGLARDHSTELPFA